MIDEKVEEQKNTPNSLLIDVREKDELQKDIFLLLSIFLSLPFRQSPKL